MKKKVSGTFSDMLKTCLEDGQITFFDRSWYNRAVVEPVNEILSVMKNIIFS